MCSGRLLSIVIKSYLKNIFSKHLQEEIRSKCAIKIPPNKVKHEGHHECKDSHTCDMRCPYCEYFVSMTTGFLMHHRRDINIGMNKNFSAIRVIGIQNCITRPMGA